jgi:hypothetical protein
VNRFVLFYLVLSLFWACSSNIQQNEQVDKDSQLVQHVVFDLVDPKVTSFSQKVDHLKTQLQNYCDTNEVNQNDVKKAWLEAMLDFHYLEALPFGPLNPKKSELSLFIYSLPQVNADKIIDLEVEKAFAKKENFKLKSPKPTLLGLDALEYIFFSYLNHDSEKRSCFYSLYVANELAKKVDEYKLRWNVEQIEYLQNPINLANLSDFIPTMTSSVITFFDQTLKERKISAPLGLNASTTNPCIAGENCHIFYTEHPYALIGKEALLENMKAIVDAFNGSSLKSISRGYGYFRYISQLEVATKNQSEEILLQQIKNQMSELSQREEFALEFKDFYIQDSVSQKWVENKKSNIYQIFLDLQNFSDWLKTDFIIELSGQLPGTVQGDND